MTFERLAWLFALAVTVHNLEEAIFLPAWSRRAGRWHIQVGEPEFRFAVVVLTLFAYLFAWLVEKGSEIGVYLLSGYALVMFLNVFAPHLFATIVLRRYAPGTATALFFNLPITFCLLRSAFEEHHISIASFAWTGAIAVIGGVALIPALFAVGRALGRR
jgi:hypothetical protein